MILPGIAESFLPMSGTPRMRRLNTMDHEEVIAYNLRDGGSAFTEFEYGQYDRVMKARAVIEHLLDLDSRTAPVIVEPGCSTGDIAGFFSDRAAVIGIDVTPGATQKVREKWPRMGIIEDRAENVGPIECDILVLTEFLEHITDPVAFVTSWMPRARYAVIGHPLVGDGWDPEIGHPWAYYDVDFANWFPMGGHELMEAWTFPMGYRMVMGWGKQP